ncbi:hypothetical protein KM043_007624 [Ampulex compressa]|nr:hypothetical protein KM043_007624 [Ampulex compressa]
MQYKNEYRRSIDAYRSTIPIRRRIGLYWILAALRIALTIAPQTGYIHPDEYFQSIELISGDHFDIDVYKPWEFNSTFPIRTASIPQIIVGIPYAILKRLSPYTFYLFGVSLRSAYFFILFPRLLMCALSFISDYCLYKICCMYGQNYKVRLIIFASSYVMLTYTTRTLSNNIELLLTSLLLYYTSQCMSYSEKVVIESDILSEKYNKAKNGVERVNYIWENVVQCIKRSMVGFTTYTEHCRAHDNVLYHSNITQIRGMDCVPHTNDSATSKAASVSGQNCSKLYVMWYICNIALTLFYGFAHQGGVLPLTFHVANELKAKPELTRVHLYTSYTYSIPTALLHLRNTQRTYVSSSKHKYKLTKDFYLYEQGSQEMEEVCSILATKIRNCEEKFMLKRIPYRLYYALPASAMHEFMECSFHNDSKLFNYRIAKAFYPHIATERLPLLRFVNAISLLDSNIFSMNSINQLWESMFEFSQQFRLLLLKIEYVKENSKTNT